MNKIDDLPSVIHECAGHSEEDKQFFSEYFQRNFYWMYGAGADKSFAHRNYFVSDYDSNLNFVKMNPVVKRIWFKICEKIEISPMTQVGRCYLLGQTAGMDGPWHPDNTEDANVRTIVYYPGFDPHHKHRGTQFDFGEEGGIQEAPYMQDHFSYFDASLMHRGLSTASEDSMRVALVFQCVHLDVIKNFVFRDTCGNDERLDEIISKEIPR